MTIPLPDPPDSLTGAPRAFYEELREMLSVVRPARVDPQRSSVEFDDDGVDVALVHSEKADWGIWATVSERNAIVGTGWAHEHFFPPTAGVVEERPWTTQMVDFIAEILRGEIEVVTTFRGTKPVAVQHFNLDENGARQSLGRTGFLTPGRLLVWRPKRTETERVSFR